jgi:hypothetical protein
LHLALEASLLGWRWPVLGDEAFVELVQGGEGNCSGSSSTLAAAVKSRGIESMLVARESSPTISWHVPGSLKLTPRRVTIDGILNPAESPADDVVARARASAVGVMGQCWLRWPMAGHAELSGSSILQ